MTRALCSCVEAFWSKGAAFIATETHLVMVLQTSGVVWSVVGLVIGLDKDINLSPCENFNRWQW